jgi:hypothetical protein
MCLDLSLTSSKEHVLRDKKNLLRFLRAVMSDDAVVSIDAGSMLYWSPAALDDELAKDIGDYASFAELTQKTRERLEHGHQKVGWEANDIRGSDTNTRGAVRDQAGVRGAQTIFTNETSDETLVDEIDEQKNDRNFWYWTSMIPEGVPYEQHQHVVMNINPQMKKVARKMQELGMNYSLADADADLVQPDHIVQARG